MDVILGILLVPVIIVLCAWWFERWCGDRGFHVFERDGNAWALAFGVAPVLALTAAISLGIAFHG